MNNILNNRAHLLLDAYLGEISIRLGTKKSHKIKEDDEKVYASLKQSIALVFEQGLLFIWKHDFYESYNINVMVETSFKHDLYRNLRGFDFVRRNIFDQSFYSDHKFFIDFDVEELFEPNPVKYTYSESENITDYPTLNVIKRNSVSSSWANHRGEVSFLANFDGESNIVPTIASNLLATQDGVYASLYGNMQSNDGIFGDTNRRSRRIRYKCDGRNFVIQRLTCSGLSDTFVDAIPPSAADVDTTTLSLEELEKHNFKVELYRFVNMIINEPAKRITAIMFDENINEYDYGLIGTINIEVGINTSGYTFNYIKELFELFRHAYDAALLRKLGHNLNNALANPEVLGLEMIDGLISVIGQYIIEGLMGSDVRWTPLIYSAKALQTDVTLFAFTSNVNAALIEAEHKMTRMRAAIEGNTSPIDPLPGYSAYAVGIFPYYYKKWAYLNRFELSKVNRSRTVNFLVARLTTYLSVKTILKNIVTHFGDLKDVS